MVSSVVILAHSSLNDINATVTIEFGREFYEKSGISQGILFSKVCGNPECATPIIIVDKLDIRSSGHVWQTGGFGKD